MSLIKEQCKLSRWQTTLLFLFGLHIACIFSPKLYIFELSRTIKWIRSFRYFIFLLDFNLDFPLDSKATTYVGFTHDAPAQKKTKQFLNGKKKNVTKTNHVAEYF